MRAASAGLNRHERVLSVIADSMHTQSSSVISGLWGQPGADTAGADRSRDERVHHLVPSRGARVVYDGGGAPEQPSM